MWMDGRLNLEILKIKYDEQNLKKNVISLFPHLPHPLWDTGQHKVSPISWSCYLMYFNSLAFLLVQSIWKLKTVTRQLSLIWYKMKSCPPPPKKKRKRKLEFNTNLLFSSVLRVCPTEITGEHTSFMRWLWACACLPACLQMSPANLGSLARQGKVTSALCCEGRNPRACRQTLHTHSGTMVHISLANSSRVKWPNVSDRSWY